MKLCDMEDYFLDPCKSSARHSLLIKSLILEDRLIKFWRKTVWSGIRNTNSQSGGNKLRLYRHFKKSFKLEGYLTNIKNHLHRKAFCQFRINAHSLMCETGRYCNIPYEQRLCRLCEMNKVESEQHFIFECSYYSDLRNQLLNQLTKDRNRHPVRQVYSLLSSSDPSVQTQLATFLFKALEEHKQSNVYTSLN